MTCFLSVCFPIPILAETAGFLHVEIFADRTLYMKFSMFKVTVSYLNKQWLKPLNIEQPALRLVLCLTCMKHFSK
jgi:hypothetical protein